jgi:hypothetical protein
MSGAANADATVAATLDSHTASFVSLEASKKSKK